MGVTNYDNLPQNLARTSMAETRQVMRERKAAQRVAGANLRYFTSQSASDFDWTGQLTGAAGDPSMGICIFNVLLVSETSRVPLVDLAVDVYVSTDGGATWNPYSRRQSQIDGWAQSGPQLSYYLVENPGVLNGANESWWNFWMLGVKNTWVAFKLQATGIDKVAISLTRTV